MGTRGVVGLFKDGKGKITYNHFDSYPDYLGVNILNELKQVSVEQMKKAFDEIKLVDEELKPTEEEIKKYGKWADMSVGETAYNNKIHTYYQLLRNLQGTLLPYFNGEVDVMLDYEDFLKDSLFCEWGYVINLDEEVLEVYKGFQETPQKNRYYVSDSDDGYYNCALVCQYPLSDLPTPQKFLNDLNDE